MVLLLIFQIRDMSNRCRVPKVARFGDVQHLQGTNA